MLRVASYLLAVGAALGCLGHLSREIERAIAVLGVTILAASFVGPALAVAPPARRAPRARRWLPFVGAALVLPAAIAAPLGMLWLVAGVLGVLALWLRPRSAALHAECASFAVATLIVAVAAECNRILPVAWHLEMAAANAYNGVASWIANEPRRLGSTAMALPLLGAGLALVAARAMLGVRMPVRRAAWSVVALLVAQLVYLVLLTPFAAWLARHRPAWQSLLLNSQWLALVVLATALAIAGARRAAAMSPVANIAWRTTWRDRRVLGGAALGLALGLLAGRAAPPPAAPARVLLYDAGYTNWKVPQHGEYGERSGGMFGLLPFLLQAAGHQVTISKDLSQLESPSPPDVVALINIQEFFDPRDKGRLLRYVRAGGSLLCMGDHTGVAGIRGPFNDLLADAGIRFVFDSATFFAEGWSTGVALRNHPLNRGVRDPETYQIWVGASLELDASAAPVVVGRYGYSDMGDMSNLRTAFLGDRRYNPDEQLGDIVLVAESRLDRGKVLVFGDTSTYQNLALARSWEVVLRSIDHLASSRHGALAPRLQWMALLLFVAGLGFVTRGGRRAAPLAAAAAGLWAASAVQSLGQAPAHALDWSRARPPSLAAAASVTMPSGLAIVDRSHGGRFDLRAWFDPSVGGLLLNLIRDGFFPIVADVFPAHALETADVFVTIAPMRSYDTAERAALQRFMERGGRLVACVGWDELDGARSLVAEHGFAVLDVPLSHFRTGDQPRDLVFRNAWALRPPAGARVLVSQWNQPVVASRSVGRGEFVLIGDTTWLWNRNLEGREQWFLGNIGFLSALARGLPITPVEGRYRDPRDAVALVADMPYALPPAPPAPAMGSQPAAMQPARAGVLQPAAAQRLQQPPHVHPGQAQPPHVHAPAPQQQPPHVHAPAAQQQQPHVHPPPQQHVHPPAPQQQPPPQQQQPPQPSPPGARP